MRRPRQPDGPEGGAGHHQASVTSRLAASGEAASRSMGSGQIRAQLSMRYLEEIGWRSPQLSRVPQPAPAAGTLGLWGQLFQAVTHMAPAAGIVFSTQYMASQGGASHALAYVLATVACTLSALVPQGAGEEGPLGGRLLRDPLGGAGRRGRLHHELAVLHLRPGDRRRRQPAVAGHLHRLPAHVPRHRPALVAVRDRHGRHAVRRDVHRREAGGRRQHDPRHHRDAAVRPVRDHPDRQGRAATSRWSRSSRRRRRPPGAG